MHVTEIKPGIYWVGVVDWNLRSFHGYSRTRQGTTYNAYLVLDDKVTLFDTVDYKYRYELLDRIGQIIDPRKIDYLVINHLEPDHSGALPYVVEQVQPEIIYTSKMGQEFMRGRFQMQDWPVQTVADTQTITLGQRDVQFMETRMLHWPDSMVSFLPQEKLLISQDAFGQNIASSERFDDWIDWSELKQEMAHYYANIILPYSGKVPKALQKISELGWDIQMIAPDHGLILKEHVQDAVNAYLQFAEQKPTRKAVIFYDTMWSSTEKMAEVLEDQLTAEGISVKLFHLKNWHHSDVMGQVWDAAAVIAGSPTHNNSIMPLVADMLTYMQGLRPKGKLGFAFGSYAWSGESAQFISNWLEKMGMQMVQEPFRVKHVPNQENIQSLREAAVKIAQKIKENVES